MDIRQLRSFLAVIDHGSFSAAAEALFTVQSNVSSHVGRLEGEVGVKLLDRRTRELTPAGRIVEQRGREILRHLTAITDDLAAIEDRIIGEIACGTTPSIGLRVIPTALTRAAQELPEVSVSVVEAHSGTLVQQLLSGDLDLAITTGASNPELRSTPLFTEDIVAIVGPHHRFVGKQTITLTDLAETKLLLPLHDNPLHQHIARAFAEADVALGRTLEVGSSTLVQAMAGADVGVALVPATAATDDSENPTTVLPVATMPPRRVALTSRRAAQQTRALEAMSAIIDSTARQAATTMPGCHSTQPIPGSDAAASDVLSIRS